VHVLNVVDGCLPADMATGSRAELEEERRLLYVAMTRARDELTLWVPQRFYVTQQRAWGDRHLYALRSRFIPDELLPLFDTALEVPATVDAGPEGLAAHETLASCAPCHGPGGASAGPLTSGPGAAGELDLLQRLFGAAAAAQGQNGSPT
jgi:mono/diheme cytochrome c family protein